MVESIGGVYYGHFWDKNDDLERFDRFGIL